MPKGGLERYSFPPQHVHLVDQVHLGPAALAVERFGEDARYRRLADAVGADEQVGVVDPSRVQRVGQRAHHVLLSDQFGEPARAPLAGEYLIGHDYQRGDKDRLCQVGARKSANGTSTMAAAPPATPRHPNHSLPLLPSGPGGVCELSSRGDRRGHHERQAKALGCFVAAPASGCRIYRETGGEGGIRTRDTGISRIHTFQACSFNHSDTSPSWCSLPRALQPDKETES